MLTPEPITDRAANSTAAEHRLERSVELQPAVKLAPLAGGRGQRPADHRPVKRGVEYHPLFVHGASLAP